MVQAPAHRLGRAPRRPAPAGASGRARRPVRGASANRPDPRLHRFEDNGSGALVKKMAGYHQFHAVQMAVAEALRAAELRREADRVAEVTGGYEAGRRPGGKPGDRRIGVV